MTLVFTVRFRLMFGFGLGKNLVYKGCLMFWDYTSPLNFILKPKVSTRGGENII